MSLLAEMPTKNDLDGALPSGDSLSIDGFDGLDSGFGSLESDLGVVSVPEPQAMDVSIPSDLSADRVTANVTAPLDKMNGMKASTFSDGMLSSSLPTRAASPSFDLNSPMSSIGSAMSMPMPSTPTVDEDMPGFDSEEALRQLRLLASAAKSTPMRMVNMYIRVFKTLIEKATDKDTLLQLAVQSLEEIFVGQITKLRYNLPVSVCDDIKKLFEDGYLDKLETFFDDIENQNGTEIELAARAYNDLLPYNRQAKRAGTTLKNLHMSQVEALTSAIEKVLEFAASDNVVLQEFFDKIEAVITQILDAIKDPINAIRDMAEQIKQFLEETADKAEAAAEQLATNLNKGLGDVAQHLRDVEEQIKQVEAQIRGFLDSIDPTPVVDGIKSACNTVASSLEAFFAKLNELQNKLRHAVENLDAQLDAKLEAALKAMETKIRELLGKITGVLERPDVKDALAKTKEGIEKFKKVMEEASLKPVFDVVVTKTGELQVKVEAINVEELGVPQKMALKVGAKVIKQVKVDEIVKPELIAIFQEIRDPIAALVKELEQGVMQVAKVVEQFEPGTVVTELLEKSPVYQEFFRVLESFKPSKLLEPLKKANEKLVDMMKQFDPDMLIDKLQGLYNKLYELVEIISPAMLKSKIAGAVNVVVNEMTNIRDFEIDKIITKLKEKISLKNLLEGTGIEDAADAEIWQQITDILSGSFLDPVTDAVDYVEQKIKDEVAKLGFTMPQEEIDEMNRYIDLQIATTASKMTPMLQDVIDLFAQHTERIDQLDNRRKTMLVEFQDSPEISDVLRRLDLAPLKQVLPEAQTAMDLTAAKLNGSLRKIKNALNAKRQELKDLDQIALQNAAPLIFKTQIGDPIRSIVTKIKDLLLPFKEAVDAIREILRTVLELPGRIDEMVATVLDAAVAGVKEVITETIDVIRQLETSVGEVIQGVYDTIKRLIDTFSPYGLLNRFAESDFRDEAAYKAVADKIAAGDGDVAAYLNSKIESDKMELVKTQAGQWKTIVKDVMNDAIVDARFRDDKIVAAAKQSVAVALAGLTPDALTEKCRLEALQEQLNEAEYKYKNTAAKTNPGIRLSRLIMEAVFEKQLNMSVQSLYPFILQQVAGLYPVEVVAHLDSIYEKAIAKVKEAPKRLIQEPLDEEYKKVINILKENFDIAGIFQVLEVKLDGMDEDLSHGLDRIGFAFNQMINALDERLAQ